MHATLEVQANILHMLPMQNVIEHNRSVMVALVCAAVAHLIQFFVRKQDKMCYHSTTVLQSSSDTILNDSIIDLVSGALLKNMRSFKNIIAWFKPI